MVLQSIGNRITAIDELQYLKQIKCNLKLKIKIGYELTLSCKLVHLISHAGVVEVVVQQEEKRCMVGRTGFRLHKISNAHFPRGFVYVATAWQLG